MTLNIHIFFSSAQQQLSTLLKPFGQNLPFGIYWLEFSTISKTNEQWQLLGGA